MDLEEVLVHLNDAIYHMETAIASLNSAGEQDIARMLEFVKELAASAEERAEKKADRENALNEQAMLREHERSVL